MSKETRHLTQPSPRSSGGEGAGSVPAVVETAADISYPEKLKARLDYLEDWYFRPQAYETKISQWEVKELRTHRPHLWREEEGSESETANAEHRTLNDEGGNPAMVVPSYVSSANELARVLDTIFRGRISIEISPTLVGQWRKGSRVGEVFVDGKKIIPPSLPKNKSGNRFVTQPCIDWVERWIVPQKGVEGLAGGTPALPGTAMDFDRLKQEHHIWQMQREKDVADGKFKSVEAFERRATIIGAEINNAMVMAELEFKKAIKIRILEYSSVNGIANAGGFLAALESGLVTAIQERFDCMRASVRKAIADAPDWKVAEKENK